MTDECHDRPGKPWKRGDKKLGRKSSKRQLSDARQLGFVFQDMTPPKSILRKCTDMRKPIQREIHKGYCTSYQNSRPKSLARMYLPRLNLMSVAPTLQKFEGRSQEETVARARCPRSSVEVGQKCVQMKGA